MECAGAIGTCIGHEIPGLSQGLCAYGVLKCLASSVPSSASDSPKRASASTFKADPLLAFGPGVRDMVDLMDQMTGDTNGVWFNLQVNQDTADWSGRFADATDPSSDGGATITPAERAGLLSGVQPPGVPLSEVTRRVDRWNRTLENWNAGIYSPSNAPSGANLDFMDYNVFTNTFLDYAQYQALAEAGGFTDPLNAIIETYRFRLTAGENGGICSTIRLRIDQNAVVAREAFRATLEFQNLTMSPLGSVGVTLQVSDASGNVVSNLFGIPDPQLTGLDKADGTGTLDPGIKATVGWTIVPTVDAAPTQPVDYFVSGELHYTLDGVPITLPLSAAAITVHPTPRLEVKYFHQRDVFADDPFTDKIEPSIPFSLAVMVQNEGEGTAHDFTIASAQPKIVDNEKGLLIDFKIIATEVAGKNLQPTLTADLGDIAPGTNAIARWLLTSTVQGLFTDYSAKFEEVDDLGNPGVSLIDDVSIHEMTHLVDAGGPFEDGRPDFLVNEIPDIRDYPDTLYLSDGSTNHVAVVTNDVVTGTLSPDNLQVELTAAMPGGWGYLNVPDPANGQYRLVGVVRSDNVIVPVETNVWVTDRTFYGLGRRPAYENILHLLDYNSTGDYTLYYVPLPGSDATTPSSAVASLPAASHPQFTVSWNGSDNAGGSGIAFYDVFASVDGGPFAPWLQHTSANNALYPGELGHTYAFYSLATDSAGNRQSPPAQPDTETSVSITNSPPTISVAPSATVDAGQTLSLDVIASDPDPQDVLSFSLGSGTPSGVALNPSNGHITWPTSPSFGGTTNPITIIVADNGEPPLSATGTVEVSVIQVTNPPVLAPIPDYTINEGTLLVVTNSATDDNLPPRPLTFSLGGNVPQGASIDPATGVFQWRPTSTQAPSTNVLTVVVTDDNNPPQSDSQQFTVVVNPVTFEFLLSVGSTNVLGGETNFVPLTLQSSLPLTNVTATLEVPEVYLNNLNLSPAAPETLSTLLQPAGSNQYSLNLALNPLLSSGGSRTLARLGFVATSQGSSAIVPLRLSQVSGLQDNGQPAAKPGSADGRIILVVREPVLDAPHVGANGAREFTLYGKPGSSYEVDYATNLVDWQLDDRIPMTNKYQVVEASSPLANIFYRAEEFSANPPILELKAVSPTNLTLLMYGEKGTNYQITVGANLNAGETWTPITSFDLSNSFQFFDAGGATNSMLFFRVRRP